MPKELTNKQQAFCREYVIDHNAKEAAERAGYSKKGSKVIGCNLLTHINCKAVIDGLEAEKQAKAGMTIERMHRQYDEDRTFARSVNAASAAVSASVSIARLYGMDKDAGTKPGDGLQLNFTTTEPGPKLVKDAG